MSQISNPDPLPFLTPSPGRKSKPSSLIRDRPAVDQKPKIKPRANALFAQTAAFSGEEEWEFSKQRLPTSWESAASPGADSTGELCYQLFVLAGDQRENFLNDFSI